MRIWTIHPKYLDSRGLVALWRETLLAQAVLRGQTRGYQHHPQLERFRACAAPVEAVSVYLASVHEEAVARGYAFDAGKIGPFDSRQSRISIPVTTGQVAYEWKHLLAKLAVRSPEVHEKWRDVKTPACHPMFKVHQGPVATW